MSPSLGFFPTGFSSEILPLATRLLSDCPFYCHPPNPSPKTTCYGLAYLHDEIDEKKRHPRTDPCRYSIRCAPRAASFGWTGEPSSARSAPAPSSCPAMSYPPYYNQAPPPPPQAAYPYAQPAYVHHPPPPPPDAREAFRHFYRSHLATLTFNSRPIINHLTQLALDQIADFPNANIVADEIAKGVFEVGIRCPFDRFLWAAQEG